MQKVDLTTIQFTPALLRTVDAATACLYETIPVFAEPGRVVLALPPMKLLQARDDELQTMRAELQFTLHREVEFVLADREQLQARLQQFYGGSAEPLPD